MVCDNSPVICIILFSFQLQTNICFTDIGIPVAQIPGPEIAKAGRLNLAFVLPVAQMNGNIHFANKMQCRNDGRRNLAEGRITERHFAAVEETNSMLDQQRREYEDAVGRGLGDFDIEVMRVRHKRDLEDAEKREAEAAAYVAEE